MKVLTLDSSRGDKDAIILCKVFHCWIAYNGRDTDQAPKNTPAPLNQEEENEKESSQKAMWLAVVLPLQVNQYPVPMLAILC